MTVRKAGAMSELAGLVDLAVRTAYGPDQLAGFLGLAKFQVERARAAGLIPPPDRARGRWSAAAAQVAAARLTEICATVGSVPDLGAGRVADLLTERLGVEVTYDGVVELGRRGLLPVCGEYKGWPVYDGQAVEALTDTAAVAEANRAGELRTTDECAAYLRVRRADFNHLVRAGLITASGWGYGPYDRKNRPTVPLYRTGDLDELAGRADINWDAVRAVPAGRRSPLAALSTADRRRR